MAERLCCRYCHRKWSLDFETQFRAHEEACGSMLARSSQKKTSSPKQGRKQGPEDLMDSGLVYGHPRSLWNHKNERDGVKSQGGKTHDARVTPESAGNAHREKEPRVRCPECGDGLKTKNLKSHLRKVHQKTVEEAVSTKPEIRSSKQNRAGSSKQKKAEKRKGPFESDENCFARLARSLLSRVR